jgi:sterol desaturase/sphingolipid hydroxylase (fatty acid hydroxylase superfamily)
MRDEGDRNTLEAEPLVRLGVFVGALAAVGICEALVRRRKRSLPHLKRWPSNLGIAALNTLVLPSVFPAAAIGVALMCEERGWGLLNATTVPEWAAVLIAVVALDFAIYLQHVLFHAVASLWRLHRVHHADLDFDVTTGGAFSSDRDCTVHGHKVDGRNRPRSASTCGTNI